MPSGIPKANTTVEERRFSAAQSHPKLTLVIPNRAKGPVRNLLLTFAATPHPCRTDTPVVAFDVDFAFDCDRTLLDGVPHFSRPLREVGTTDARSAVLEVDAAFDLENSYQDMPSRIPNPNTPAEEQRFSAA